MGISKFESARRASGMSNIEAARTAGFKEVTIYAREDDPGSWRLRELARIYRALDDTGKGLLFGAIDDFFENAELT